MVAVVSAALWCRDWRLALPAAAPLLAAGRVTVGVGVRPLERLRRGGGQWLLKGSGISYKLPLIYGAASHYLKRNCLPFTQLPAGFNPGVVVAASVVVAWRRWCVVGLAAAVFQSLSLVVFCGSWRRRGRGRLCSGLGAVGFGASRWVGGRVGFVCGCRCLWV
ncbi:MAG: hypothetical protein GU356_09055 [Pyrobaculum sp.]|nr:hypothetical protein [Pyrobaculum sp.]